MIGPATARRGWVVVLADGKKRAGSLAEYD